MRYGILYKWTLYGATTFNILVLIYKLKVNVMESFFDREVKRLEYVGERQQLRGNQKKELDAAMAAKEQVHGYWVVRPFPISQAKMYLT